MKKIQSLILAILIILQTTVCSVFAATPGEETVYYTCLAEGTTYYEITEVIGTPHLEGPKNNDENVMLPDGKTLAPQYIMFKNFTAGKENYLGLRYLDQNSWSNAKDFSNYDYANTYIDVSLMLKPIIDSGKYQSLYLGLCAPINGVNGWNDQIIVVDLVKFISDKNLKPDGDYYNIKLPLSYLKSTGKVLNATSTAEKLDSSISWRYREIDKSLTYDFNWAGVGGIAFGAVAKNDVTSGWSDTLYMNNPRIVYIEPQPKEPFTATLSQISNVDPSVGVTVKFSSKPIESLLKDAFSFEEYGVPVSGNVTYTKVDDLTYTLHSTGLRGLREYTLKIAKSLTNAEDTAISTNSFDFSTKESDYGVEAAKNGEIKKITFEESEYVTGAEIESVDGWTVEQRSSDDAIVAKDPDDADNHVLALTIDNTNSTYFFPDDYGARLSLDDTEIDGLLNISYRVKIKNSGDVKFKRKYSDRIGMCTFGTDSGSYSGLQLMGWETENELYFNSCVNVAESKTAPVKCGDVDSGWVNVNIMLNPNDSSLKITATQEDANKTYVSTNKSGFEETIYSTAAMDDKKMNNVKNILFSIAAPDSSYADVLSTLGKSTLYVDDISVTVVPFLTATPGFLTKSVNPEAPLKLKFNNKVVSDLQDKISIEDKSGTKFPGAVTVNMDADGKTAYVTATGDLKFDTEYTLKIDSTNILDEYNGGFASDVSIPLKTRYSNSAYINGFTNISTQTNNQITVDFSVINAADTAQSPLVALAAYDADGAMIGSVVKPYTNLTTKVDDTLTISVDGTAKRVVAYVWESSSRLVLKQKPYVYIYN